MTSLVRTFGGGGCGDVVVDELAPLHHEQTEPAVLVVLVSEDVPADLAGRRQITAVGSRPRERHSCTENGTDS